MPEMDVPGRFPIRRNSVSRNGAKMSQSEKIGEMISDDYAATGLPGREREVQTVIAALNSLSRRKKPQHVWIYGPTGSGKTAVARHATSRFERECPGGKTVFVNCWERPSAHAVVNAIVSALTPFYKEGRSLAFGIEWLRLHLREQTLVALLDGIDTLPPRDRNILLYGLCKTNNVGVLCVSLTLEPYYLLDERVRSRLFPRVVRLRRYTHKEIKAILLRCGAKRLAGSEASALLMSRIASLCNGDARLGTRLFDNRMVAKGYASWQTPLSRSAKVPENPCVDRRFRITRLTQHHQIFAGLIGRMPGISTPTLWKHYLNTCQQKGVKPIAYRTQNKYLHKLARLGLISICRGAQRGNVNCFR